MKGTIYQNHEQVGKLAAYAYEYLTKFNSYGYADWQPDAWHQKFQASIKYRLGKRFPKCINNMDFDAIMNSVKKTGRLLVVHEAAVPFSVGAEIVRRVVEAGFDYLDAEPLVIGNHRAANPFAGNLENTVMLKPEDVQAKMKYLMTGIL